MNDFQRTATKLPSTEDPDTIKKSLLGYLPVDDIPNHLGFRLRGNFLRTVDYAPQTLDPNLNANP